LMLKYFGVAWFLHILLNQNFTLNRKDYQSQNNLGLVWKVWFVLSPDYDTVVKDTRRAAVYV